jgi:uncharacterized protein (DUF1697 family)
MIAVVSLLRAINVGTARQVDIAAVRQVYAGLGLADVATYLRSGNVVFTTGGAVNAALVGRIEAALKARFGFAIPVVNRTLAELRATVAANPFPEEARREPAKLVVVFLPQPPSQAERAALAKPVDGPERLQLAGADLYVHYAAGIGRSKLKLPLAVPGTARNWTTIAALVAMAERAEATAVHSQPVATRLRSRPPESAAQEEPMAKGQMRSNKEKRKPKADKNKPKKGTPAPAPGTSASMGAMKK